MKYKKEFIPKKKIVDLKNHNFDNNNYYNNYFIELMELYVENGIAYQRRRKTAYNGSKRQ